MEILATNVIECIKWSNSKQLAGYVFVCCIAMALSLPLLVSFMVPSLLAVSLFQLASTDERSSWEYGCAWHHLRILRKNLGRRGWRKNWCFPTSFSCCSHCRNVLLWRGLLTDNIRRTAASMPGLKYLQSCGLALIDQLLVLSTSDYNNKTKMLRGVSHSAGK